MMVEAAVTQLLQRRDAVYNDLRALEPHRDRFFAHLEFMHPGFVRTTFILTSCSCLLLLVCCASYVVCCCLFKVVCYCFAPRSNFLGKDEVMALSRRWQRSDMNVHGLDKRSQWLALRIFLPNFHGRSNVTKVGDLHEAWLLSMTEDGSFDDVLPAYKTFANNVMLLQGTSLYTTTGIGLSCRYMTWRRWMPLLHLCWACCFC